MAEALQEAGQLQMALRCLAESFLFVDDLWIRQTYQMLRSQVGLENKEPSSPLKQAFAAFDLVVSLAGMAALLGGLLGFVDYFLMDFVFNNGLWEFRLLQPLLEWLILLGLGAVMIVFLGRFGDRKTSINTLPALLLFSLGLVTALLFLNGVLTGRGIANFLDVFINAASLPPPSELATAFFAVLTRSPRLELIRCLQLASAAAAARLVYLGGLSLFALVGIQAAVWGQFSRQKRLAELTGKSSETHITRNLSASAVLLGLSLLLFLLPDLVPQRGAVDFLQARDHHTAGVDLEYQGNFLEAKAEFSTAVHLDPYMAEAYRELGWVLDQLGYGVQAITVYQKALDLAPQHADTWYWMGTAAYFEGQTLESASAFRKAIELEPTMADAYLGLGWALYEQGELDQAQLNFEKTLDMDPGLYDAFLGLGAVYDDRGLLEEQILVYKSAAQSEGAPPEAFLYLGLAYNQVYDYELAADAFEKNLFLQPDNDIARVYLVQSYLDIGKLDQALSLIEKMLTQNPQDLAGLSLSASVHLAMNQADAARQQVVTALALQPETDLDYALLLNALLKGGWYAEAEVEARKAFENAFDRGGFALYLADALAEQGKYTEALAACDEAAKLGVRESRVRLEKAFVHFVMNDLQASLAELNQSLRLDDRDPEIPALLAQVYYELNDNFRSGQFAEQAVSLNQYHSGAYTTLALAKLALNDLDGAIASAQRASELAPYAAAPHFVLGVSYDHLKKDAAALFELNKFIELYRGSSQSDTTLQEVEEMVKKLKESLGISG